VLRVIVILLLAARPVIAEPARCESRKLEKQANALERRGKHVAALAKYEAAARCKPSDQLHTRIAIVACFLARQTRSQRFATKEHTYLVKLPMRARDEVYRACGGDV
jgi:hypothetical protein